MHVRRCSPIASRGQLLFRCSLFCFIELKKLEGALHDVGVTSCGLFFCTVDLAEVLKLMRCSYYDQLRQKSRSPSSVSCVAARKIVRRSVFGPVRGINKLLTSTLRNQTNKQLQRGPIYVCECRYANNYTSQSLSLSIS